MVLVILQTEASASEYTAIIAFQAALSPSTSPDQKVPRSECKECNGTGKVTVGDGITKFVVDCDNCYEEAAIPSPYFVEPVVEPSEPVIKLMIFGADYCGWCKKSAQEMSNENIPYEYIDVQKSPDIQTMYDITLIPTYIVLEDNEVKKKIVGYKTIQEIKGFFSW